jgi:hypothetical protein
VVAVERSHFAAHGHYAAYGWHIDVATVIVDPQAATPRPVPGGGLSVPAEGQWTKIRNFTILPALVEACMSGKTPVFPFRLEKLDQVTGKWIVFPPSEGQKCFNVPITAKLIWPLESFHTMPVPIAKFDWFHRGDRVRIVAISKCDKPSEAHREFVSAPFQLH